MSVQDGIDAVRRTWSTADQYTAESVAAAAGAIAELWRYLGHATIHGDLLRDPADAHAVFVTLSAADHTSVGVLERLARYAADIGDQADRYGHDTPDGTADQIPGRNARSDSKSGHRCGGAHHGGRRD
ncbi:hypothetical protein ABIA39_008508 [Nocardia sp. GAS34]|uniref:hypothetical protein n=1 Tax=unclassified Nocardia TaxID=2637762 RepID=UPI003D1F5483